MVNQLQEFQPSINQRIFIFFALLHSLRFFNFAPYVKLGGVLALIDFILFLYYFFILFKQIARGTNNKAWKVCAFLYIPFILGIFVAYFWYGENMYYSLRNSLFLFLNFGLFFYLVEKNISISFLIKVCVIFAFLFCLANLITYFQYPDNIFGYVDSDEMADKIANSYDQRGFYRFNIQGGDYLTLCLFYLLSSNQRIKGKYFLILLLVSLTFLRGTRGPIIFTLLIAAITYLFSKPIRPKETIFFSILILVAAITILYIPVTRRVVDSLLLISENEYYDYGDENIRLIALRYFTLDFNEGNWGKILIGNGIPGQGPYFDKMTELNSVLHIYSTDIEYMMWFVYFGLLGIFLLLYWGRTMIKLRVDKSNYYLKFFIIYLFMVMLLGSHFIREAPMIALVCYLIYKNNLLCLNSSEE